MRYGCVCSILLLIATPAWGQTGTIEGRVTDALTRQALRKADVVVQLVSGGGMRPSVSVTLTDGSPGGVRMATAGAQVRTTTDTNGEFRIDGLEPGGYSVRAERQGYTRLTYRAEGDRLSTMVQVTEGGTSRIEAAMMPQGVIAGRVMDPDGDPVVNSQVMLMQYRYVNGRKQLSNAGRVATTDDLGNFRIFGIEPGKYYLSATAGPGRGMNPDERQVGDSEELVQTFYPGTADTASAAPLDVAAGTEIQGLQIGLRRQHVFHVRGRIINESGVESERLTVSLQNLQRGGGFVQSYGAVAAPDGSFEIRRVPTGSYVAVAAAVERQEMGRGYTPVEVGASDVDNLVVTLTRGFEVSGKVRFDGQTPPKTAGSVTLQPIEPAGAGMSSARIAEDGSFTLPRVWPGRYVAMVSSPGQYYLSSTRLGAQDVTDEPVTLVSGSGPLLMVMRDDPGRVEGVVRDGGDPAAGARVVLVPEKESLRGLQRTYRQATSDSAGMFRMGTLPPGEYRLFAWKQVEEGAWMDPEFIKQYESKGRRVTVTRGGAEQVELKLIEQEK